MGWRTRTGYERSSWNWSREPTLADRIAQRPNSVDEALPIAKQIAEALEAAHEQGIIHRDLKPANIKVRPDGTVKVLDFGLAKALEPTSGSADATASPTITSPAMTGVGVLLGTAAYMSPEQARGKAVDKRSDIWAFGCVLYEMLTGKRAFEDEDVSMTLSKVLQREPDFEALPTDVPARVHQTFVCACGSLRENVLPDIGAVRLALEGAFETAAPQHMVRVGRTAMLATGAAGCSCVAGHRRGPRGGSLWSLWPVDRAAAGQSFRRALPEGQQFRNIGRPVMALSPDGRQFVYNATGGLYLRTMGDVDSPADSRHRRSPHQSVVLARRAIGRVFPGHPAEAVSHQRRGAGGHLCGY